MIKCVIFDMDGVVVNTEPIGYRANKEMYKSLNINVPDDVYASFIGNSDKNIVQKLKACMILISLMKSYWKKNINTISMLLIMPMTLS